MSTHAPTLASPEARFGLADLLRVVGRRRLLIRNITLATIALTALVVMAMPTLYSTSAIVMLDQRKNNVADVSSVLSALPTDPSSVQNQIQVLSSRDLALKVIGKLRLYADPEFNAALDRSSVDLNPLHWLGGPGGRMGDARDAIVNAFLSRLDVSALGLSTSIDVNFTANDPRKAALIANTLAQSYTEDQVATKIEASRRAASWLSERMRQLAQQVQIQEAAVELYKSENDLVDSEEGKSLVDQQLVAINAQLVAAQSDLAEKKAAYDRVAALARTGNAADVTQVVTSKMIGDLRTQEAELVRQEADLASRYGPNHPKMIAIRNEKRDLEAKIAREVASVAGSMQSDLEVARAHVGSIEASLERVEHQARADNIARIKLNSLLANLASTRTMYESFVTRLRAVQDQDDIQVPEARVISTAPVPSAPSSPHRMLFVAASLPAGLLLGILAALLAERFQGSLPESDLRQPPVRTAPVAPAAMPEPAPLPQPVALPPVLATLSATSDMRVADWLADNPGSAYGLALAALARSLRPMPGGPARVVMLTSAATDVGKSVIALSLARIAALGGLNVLLVDGDQGRSVPGAAGTGLAAFLGGAPIAGVVLKDRRTNAHLLPAGGAVWGAPRLPEAVAYLRRCCDLVLIDGAAVLAGDVCASQARLSDGVLVLTAANAPQAGFEAALRSLVAMGAKPAGLVVTR
ncbi:MAG TPA: exopolysaccharide transport family protein [Rhizomicrobium sp.]|nr:exopolysaccharide transport family protein [Rhizomicrobium sp.]